MDRSAQVIAASLLGKYRPIYFSGGDTTILSKVDIDKTLVVSEIKIRFSTIICHKYFTVLIRTHGAWIDVDIGIELLNGDFMSPSLQKLTQRRCSDAFSKRRYNATRYKNILGTH